MLRARCVQTEPPPTAEKERPGASVKATRANKKSTSVDSKQPSINTARGRRQESHRDLSVYDGQVRLAGITYDGDHYRVLLPTGLMLGSFATLKQALAEISAAQGGAR